MRNCVSLCRHGTREAADGSLSLIASRLDRIYTSMQPWALLQVRGAGLPRGRVGVVPADVVVAEAADEGAVRATPHTRGGGGSLVQDDHHDPGGRWRGRSGVEQRRSAHGAQQPARHGHGER